MITPSGLRIRAYYRGYLDVFWSLGSTFDDLNGYSIYVQRADSVAGPYVDVSPALRAVEHYRDAPPRYHSFFSKVFYRLRVVNRATAEERVVPAEGGVSLEAPPDLHAMEIARHTQLRLSKSEGRLLWVFPRKHSGQRCTVCYDKVTARSRRADCPSCYGTTFVGGYHTPIRVYGQIVSPQAIAYHTQNGPVESLSSLLKIGNFPELSDGDVIIEAENLRWKVGISTTRIEKSRFLVRQEASISAVPIEDIEYSLPFDLTADAYDATPKWNYTNPANLETAALSADTSAVHGRS